MSKAKHTQGKWEVKSGNIVSAIYANDYQVAFISGAREEHLANARLIAEAPTLKDTLSSARVVLARMRRSMSVHPDHEVGSEFDDLTTESQILEDEIMELIRRIEG